LCVWQSGADRGGVVRSTSMQEAQGRVQVSQQQYI
jgi:hypothetical protein